MVKCRAEGKRNGVLGCQWHHTKSDKPHKPQDTRTENKDPITPGKANHRKTIMEISFNPPLIYWTFPENLTFADQWERCQSGRMCLIRNQVYRKVPGVRIPPSPLSALRNRRRTSPTNIPWWFDTIYPKVNNQLANMVSLMILD